MPIGFWWMPECAPAQDLEELLERADPAGKRKEGRRLRRHQRLALVHAGDDMELGESVVRDLLRCEGVGDHADRPPPCPEDGVGHDSHQPDPAAAVDKVNPCRTSVSPTWRRFLYDGRVPGDEPQKTQIAGLIGQYAVVLTTGGVELASVAMRRSRQE